MLKLKIKNSKFLILNFIFTFHILNFTFPCFAQDKIVAIVNNDIITQKDLNDFINFMSLQLSSNYSKEEAQSRIQSMKQDLLDKLIEDRLILQEAKRQKLVVDEQRVKSKISEIKKGYASDMEFQDALARQGLVQADIETRLREQLLMYNIVEIKIRRKAVVNPSEVTDFYNRNKEEFILPEQREFESLTLSDENMFDDIADDVRKGLKINDLAKNYSLPVNKFTVTGQGQLRKDIEEVVFKLKPQEMRGPIKIQDGYYVFKLNKINPPRQQKLSEAQDRINSILLERKMEEQLSRWLDELKKKSYIKIIQE